MFIASIFLKVHFKSSLFEINYSIFDVISFLTLLYFLKMYKITFKLSINEEIKHSLWSFIIKVFKAITCKVD